MEGPLFHVSHKGFRNDPHGMNIGFVRTLDGAAMADAQRSLPSSSFVDMRCEDCDKRLSRYNRRALCHTCRAKAKAVPA